jgi:hypothetical protein
MKKTILAVLLAVLALGPFTGVAAAKTSQEDPGSLHEYMEEALAEKLGLPLADVEAQFDAGKTLCQIALDNGISQADLPAFMLEVRTAAINAALADGVITQAQADRMLRGAGRGMGSGKMLGGRGTGPCGGTGVPAGTGMHRGGRRQPVNP